MRKNFNKIVALSMSVFMVGSMVPAMNVKADSAKATAVKAVNSDFINGDFEKGIEPWQFSSSSPENYKVVEEGDNHVLQATSEGDIAIRNTAWYVEPAVEYVISYDAKIEGEGSVKLNKYEWDTAWNRTALDVAGVGELTTTGDEYKTVQYKFKAADKTGFIQLDIFTKGTVKIDNVTITKAQPSVVKADFSNASGWTGVSVSEKTGTKDVIKKDMVAEDTFDDSTNFQLGQSQRSSVSNEKAYTGSTSLKIEGGNGNWGKALLNIWYPFETNTDYKLALKVYTDNEDALGSLVLANAFSNASTSTWGVGSIELLPTGLEKGKWVTYVGTFKTPATAIDLDQLQICVRPSSDVVVYFDDVEIYKEVPTTVDVYSDGIGAFGVNGDKALKMESTDKVSYNASKLVEGTKYAYSYDLKVTDAESDFAFTTSLSDNQNVTADCGWTTVSGTFVAGKDKNITLNKAGKGVAYVDNLTVEEVVDIHVHHGSLKEYGASCTEDSRRIYKCDDCGKNVYVEYTGDYEGGEKATGHDYKKVKTVAATYTAKGYTEHKCSKCGSVKKDSYTAVKKLAKVKKVKATAKKKALKISWAKATGAKKYEIQVSTKSNFKKAIKKTTTKKSYTVKKLKAKKKYYVRVRAVRTEGKTTVTGSWSSKISKKTK